MGERYLELDRRRRRPYARIRRECNGATRGREALRGGGSPSATRKPGCDCGGSTFSKGRVGHGATRIYAALPIRTARPTEQDALALTTRDSGTNEVKSLLVIAKPGRQSINDHQAGSKDRAVHGGAKHGNGAFDSAGGYKGRH